MQFRNLTDQESTTVQPQQQASSNPENNIIQFKTVDAPHNTVFDADKNRIIALPQTLTADETNFVIKRDADEVKDFFSMENTNGIVGLSKGLAGFFGQTPQVAGTLLKEQGELSKESIANMLKNPSSIGSLNPFKTLGQLKNLLLFNSSNDLIKSGDKLIDRNRKYMKDVGFDRPEHGVWGKVAYDIGNGAGAMLTMLGLTALTRSPAAGLVVMGAMQKSQTYQEASEKNKQNTESGKPQISASEKSDISSADGIMNMALEGIGFNALLKALKGNSAIKRIVEGFLIEGAQEGTQQAQNELLTQATGIRDKKFTDTVEDILYNGMIGGIVGGITGGVLHTSVKEDAINKGIEEPVAEALGDYAEKNFTKAQENMSEFVDKELAPIAADDKSAQEFMQLMKQFSNDHIVVDREQLTPEQQHYFDQYVDMFNKSFPGESNKYIPTAKVESLRNEAHNVVLQKGKETGFEHGIIIDNNAELSHEFFTSNSKNRLDISKELQAILDNPKNSITVVHNHPSGMALSKSDIANLSSPGLQEVRALGHNGQLSVASLTPKIKKYLLDKPESYKLLGKFYDEAEKIVHRKFQNLVDTRQKTVKEVTSLSNEAVNKILEKAGIIDYTSNYEVEAFTDNINEIIDFGAKIVKNKLEENGIKYEEGKGANRSGDKVLPGGTEEQAGTTGTNNTDTGTTKEITNDYEVIRNEAEISTLGEDTGYLLGDFVEIGADTFVPVSTRLGNIHPKLKAIVRRYVFNMGLTTHNDKEVIQPFIEKVSDMEIGDYKEFDFALKNRDNKKIDELLAKYKLEKEFQQIRSLLDGIYDQAQEVAIELGFIEDYFPRQVRRNKAGEYLAAMRGQPEWGDIQIALHAIDPKGEMDEQEQAAFVNSFLRGYNNNKIKLTKPAFSKERAVDYVSPEFNKYYDDSMQTLINYINAARNSIETRKLFGKGEVVDDTIGHYVLGLMNEGIIKANQETELKKILKSVVEPSGTKGVINAAKNVTYVYTMGSPISALTQLQDLAFSLAKNGYFRTGKGLLKSLTGNQLLSKEDLGLENILQEFEGETRTAKAVRLVFKYVGLSSFDNVGKETYIDAAYSRLKSINKKNSKEWNSLLKNIFGEESAQVKKDLTSGEISENVKYLLFSELSDVQPISLAEMPVNYLRSGNGRIFYMLKTYTIKQIDIYRNEVYSKIRTGEPKQIAEGLHNLIKLGMALMLMGMGTDALKDLVLGRPIDIDSLVTDNILKSLGFTKYQIYKSKEDGAIAAFFNSIVPPIAAPLTDIQKDIQYTTEGKRSPKDSEVVQHIPFVGKFYYWWFGGGVSKLQRQKKGKTTTP